MVAHDRVKRKNHYCADRRVRVRRCNLEKLAAGDRSERGGGFAMWATDEFVRGGPRRGCARGP
jgi:hypothetical protein